ncbi:hypothetical protein [Neorhizobium petrolearium]|uniref:hypothetical protein n=1 Tax=Neorhizobium petrolearium TaxID=515361 RepID=UPI003F1561E6
MRQGFRRVAVPAPARQNMQTKTFPAPTRGWVVNENLMMTAPGSAVMMENWFPTQRGIRLRGGSTRRATIGNGPVVSLFSYQAGTIKKLFATSSTALYDVTTVANPTVPPAPAFSGLTSGYFSTTHMTNANGAVFLYAVNGTDDPRTFNGTTWQAMNASSTPTLTGATGLNAVWKHRNRLFFTQTGTMDAWYLAINSIGGALTKLPLAGVFQRGGSLLFGATWSTDAGDGMDDKCVFVTTEGEVAIYQGADPGTIADWALVGRYDISKPIGKNGFCSVGGDLLIITEEGIVPLSAATTKDPAALSLSAVTRAIEPEWRKEVLARRALPWEMEKWPSKGMMIVTLPANDLQEPYCFVANLQTGAWAKYTGWDTRCLSVFDDWAHFGTSDGRIMQCELGGTDDGETYVNTVVLSFDPLGALGYQKQVHMGRSIFLASQTFTAALSVSTDYQIDLPTPPNTGASTTVPGLWDVGLWDVSVWDDALGIKSVKSKWESIGMSGFAIAPQIQVTCDGPNLPDAELVGIDITFEQGAFVI